MQIHASYPHYALCGNGFQKQYRHQEVEKHITRQMELSTHHDFSFH
jgi:hypothetical protein